MKPWLIIPAKPFDEAKSRLAGVLSPALRSALSAYLLERTLRIAFDAGFFARIAVVSRDASALALADAFGALPLVEDVADLNAAVRQACRVAEGVAAEAALILPADLPALGVEDLRLLIRAFSTPRTVVISPSRDNGTNALLLTLPAPFDFAFGPESFCIHSQRAGATGCTVEVVHSAALSFDLDLPSDLAELAAVAPPVLQALLPDASG